MPVAVPKIGVIRVGVLARTTDPEPVLDIDPVPPLATESAVLNVNDVAEAAPRVGVTNIGELDNTIEPEPVLVVVPVPPLT